jgi:hypothetical protein
VQRFTGIAAAPPLSAAATYTLFDPGTSDVCLDLVVISTDNPQWVTVGFGPTALPLFVGPGGVALDMHSARLSDFNAIGRPITLTMSLAGGLGALVTGAYIPVGS